MSARYHTGQIDVCVYHRLSGAEGSTLASSRVARMERSVIRGCLAIRRFRSRIALRSFRATAAPYAAAAFPFGCTSAV